MSDFKIAVELTLQHEGGWVNNPADPGGETNMGITQRDMPGQNMKELTVEQAIQYYQDNYWKPLYSQIKVQLHANKLFDMGVLFGVKEAALILQQALNITQDGAFGPVSLETLNTADPISVLQSYKTHLVNHAIGIVAKKLTERPFFAGWVRRINS
jgi:lysozyme family protein